MQEKKPHCKELIEIAVLDARDIEAEQSVSVSVSSLLLTFFDVYFKYLTKCWVFHPVLPFTIQQTKTKQPILSPCKQRAEKIPPRHLK